MSDKRNQRTDWNRVIEGDPCPTCRGKTSGDCEDCFGTGQVSGDDHFHQSISCGDEQRAFADECGL